MIGSTLSLGLVIDALVTMRILVQFIGQMAALVLLRRTQPDMPRPFRVWLYPLPLVLALFGWLFLFATTDPFVILFGLALLAAGAVAFLLWSRQTRRWPFELAWHGPSSERPSGRHWAVGVAGALGVRFGWRSAC